MHVLKFMPGGRHLCKRIARDMSVGLLSNLESERRMPRSIDIRENLNFDRNGMFVFYTGNEFHCNRIMHRLHCRSHVGVK